MPFVSPMLFGSSEVAYVALLEFEPGNNAPSASEPTTSYDSSITIINDPDGYFSGIANSLVYDVAIWQEFGDYEFVLVENTLNVTSNTFDVNIVDVNYNTLSGSEFGVEQTIFQVMSSNTPLFPSSVTKTIVDTTGIRPNDGLSLQWITSEFGSRNLTGSIKIGIKKI